MVAQAWLLAVLPPALQPPRTPAADAPPPLLRLPSSLPPQGEIHAAVKRSILATGLFEGQGRSREINMLAEMVTYGDSGAFLEKVWMGE